MGVVYGIGEDVDEESVGLRQRIKQEAHAASSRSSQTPSSCARSSRTSDCPPSLHGPDRRSREQLEFA